MFNPPPGIDREQYQTSRQALTWFMVIVSLLLIGALSGVIALGVLAHLFGIGNVIFNLTICLIAIPVCAACIVGVVTLMPVARRPVDFAPRLSVPPEAEGQPFDVRLQPKGMVGDSFTGEGVVQFLPDHMTIDGMRNSFLIQSSILVVVTVVPQLLFKLALGVVPALILSSYLGRTKIVQTIPYHAIRTIILDGNTITLACPSLSPNTFIFYVASVDGSRLHGEIQPRFAALLLASQ